MKNNIKFLRRSQEFDITQEELARVVGIARPTLSEIENGRNTTLEIAVKIAAYFNKDVRDIFFIDDVVLNLQHKSA